MGASNGQSFGPYDLLGEISRGGMADVQYAVLRGRHSGPVYALKRILPQFAADPSYRRFFAAEIDLSRCLNHPNIVKTVDSGAADGIPYLTMELIHGRALNRVLHAIGSQSKRLPLPYANYLAIRALEGLDYVHHAKDAHGQDLNVVLCDLSPSNIMVGYDGQVKLIDFGIATSRVRFFEQIGLVKGKKNYMAPEQLRGLPLDHRADIFAMGLCLFELISAQSVFGGKSDFEIEEAVRSGRLPSLAERVPNVPEALHAIVSKALALDPEDRYPSAAAFAAALAPFAVLGKGTPIAAPDLARVFKLYASGFAQQDEARLAQVLEQLEGADGPQSSEAQDDPTRLTTSAGPLPGTGSKEG